MAQKSTEQRVLAVETEGQNLDYHEGAINHEIARVKDEENAAVHIEHIAFSTVETGVKVTKYSTVLVVTVKPHRSKQAHFA